MNTKKLSKMGKTLVEHANNRSLPSLSQNVMLAPYIEQASKTMTMRQISSFISENFEYSISASTVNRILNNKEEHYYNLAQYLKKVTEFLDKKPSEFLITRDELEAEEWLSPSINLYNDLCEEFASNRSIGIKMQLETASELHDIWDNLPIEAQHELLELMNLNPTE